LVIEPDDDSRVTYAEYLQTFRFTVLTADTGADGFSRASDADVIVTGIRVPASRTPKCQQVYRLVMVL
jgi:DNA-binding response OmpR family regulator